MVFRTSNQRQCFRVLRERERERMIFITQPLTLVIHLNAQIFLADPMYVTSTTDVMTGLVSIWSLSGRHNNIQGVLSTGTNMCQSRVTLELMQPMCIA
jgi:hypothetical protein